VAAAEVAQLYLHIPGGPARVLRGFEKKYLQPGEEAEVVFELNRRDMSTWDVVEQVWVLQSGEYGVMVGKSYCLDEDVVDLVPTKRSMTFN
jgi:beta-glucosidase